MSINWSLYTDAKIPPSRAGLVVPVIVAIGVVIALIKSLL